MFINFEGGDGTGKDTIFKMITKNYPNAILHREPGGTIIAERIRSILLDLDMNQEKRAKAIYELVENKNTTTLTKEYLENAFHEVKKNDISAIAEVYLFAASRAQANEELIRPAKEKGGIIFGRRSVASSVAYQGYARENELKKLGINDPISFVWEVNKKAVDIIQPDLELLFDVPTEIALHRLSGRTEKQDRLDQETEGFHYLTREGYLFYYEKICPYPWKKIDASSCIEDVYIKVKETLNPYFS